MIACKNCKHHRGTSFVAVHFGPEFMSRFPLCTHPARKTPDPVYGVRSNNRPCGWAREDEKDCGPDARMFEPSLRHKIVTALFGSKADV